MSFLSNGNSPRMAPKGPPNQDRSVRPDREALEAAFSGEMNEPVEPVSRPPAYERPSFAPSAASTLAPTSSGPTAAEKCTNVIAAGARWQGTLTVEDSVRVDGTFAGEIDAKGTIHVTEGAQVDAKIRAGYVVINGEFRGEIRCEQRVDLMPRSRVNGEVITKILSIHEGATLDGAVKMSGGIDADARRPAGRLGRSGEERSERSAVGARAQDEA
jgi:cytoskeletal protein CcmA (bactofilin family)